MGEVIAANLTSMPGQDSSADRHSERPEQQQQSPDRRSNTKLGEFHQTTNPSIQQDVETMHSKAADDESQIRAACCTDARDQNLPDRQKSNQLSPSESDPLGKYELAQQQFMASFEKQMDAVMQNTLRTTEDVPSA